MNTINLIQDLLDLFMISAFFLLFYFPWAVRALHAIHNTHYILSLRFVWWLASFKILLAWKEVVLQKVFGSTANPDTTPINYFLLPGFTCTGATIPLYIFIRSSSLFTLISISFISQQQKEKEETQKAAMHSMFEFIHFIDSSRLQCV